ncbi:hypothetical protein BJ742DRAFT_465431 [Cladochytrium replicatum]|nr:hypothetical protein BJ742DRAFT_465431 [Cladochytrium replicatum]
MDSYVPGIEDDRDRPSREKFRRERDDPDGFGGGAGGGGGGSYVRRDSFGDADRRRRRDRSLSGGGSRERDDRRKRRRSNSPRGGRSIGGGGGAGGEDGDHYIPNYARDGYVPAPRYGGGADSYNGRKREEEMYSYPDPNKLDYMVPKKQFAEWLKHQNSGREIDDEDLSKKYKEYREAFTQRQVQAFFDQHKEEEWFRERYHLEESVPLRKEINQRKSELLQKFVSELEHGLFDGICFDGMSISRSTGTGLPNAPATDPENKETENKDAENKDDPMKEDAGVDDTGELMDEDMPDSPTKKDDVLELPTSPVTTAAQAASVAHLGPDFKSNAVFIKSVPINIKRAAIVEACQNLEGFRYLVLSDPNPSKKFARLGWMVFKDEVGLQSMLETLGGVFKVGDFTLSLMYHQNTTNRSRSIPYELNSCRRLQHDNEQIRRLATFLEEDSALTSLGSEMVQGRLDTVVFPKVEEEFKGDGESDTGAKAKIEEMKLKRSLDLYIEYLRRVHLYDYYSGYEGNSPEDFSRRCPPSLRRQDPNSDLGPRDQRVKEQIDLKVRVRMNTAIDGDDITGLGGKTLTTEIEKASSEFITRVDEGKYRCKHCGKLFKGEQFVQKHLKVKHEDKFDTVKADLVFFNRFARDFGKVQMSAAPQTVTGMAVPLMGAGSGGRYSSEGNRDWDRESMDDGRGYGAAGKVDPRSLDPRSVRSYVDLDKPVTGGGDIEIDYD